MSFGVIKTCHARFVLGALAAVLGGVVLASCGLQGDQPSAEAHPSSISRIASYVWQNGDVRSVSGSWRVPSVLGGPSFSTADTWIGAQRVAYAGRAPSPFIQIGTAVTVYNYSEIYYSAFWSDTEHHFHPIPVHLTVGVGDQIAATIHRISDGWELKIADRTIDESQTVIVHQEAMSPMQQAEWAQEIPSTGPAGRLALPYPRLGDVEFTRTTINDSVPDPQALTATWLRVKGQDYGPGPMNSVGGFRIYRRERPTSLPGET